MLYNDAVGCHTIEVEAWECSMNMQGCGCDEGQVGRYTPAGAGLLSHGNQVETSFQFLATNFRAS